MTLTADLLRAWLLGGVLYNVKQCTWRRAVEVVFCVESFLC